MLYLAIGILGATVMPHNLYLHSSIVQTRRFGKDDGSRRDGVRLSTIDTIVSLAIALLINAAIPDARRHGVPSDRSPRRHRDPDAYRLLTHSSAAQWLPFFSASHCSRPGQSSTFTGTIAGQIVMEGFLDLKIPCWQRRLLTPRPRADSGHSRESPGSAKPAWASCSSRARSC